MTETSSETLSVVVEREFAHPPEKIWRALTQPHLIEAWLMKNDFKPDVGHRFNLSAEWGAVDCQVLEVEPNKTLSYKWDTKDLRSVVTGRSSRRARAPTCAWNRRVSSTTSGRITRGPRVGGRGSLPVWSRCWSGQAEARHPIRADSPSEEV